MAVMQGTEHEGRRGRKSAHILGGHHQRRNQSWQSQRWYGSDTDGRVEQATRQCPGPHWPSTCQSLAVHNTLAWVCGRQWSLHRQAALLCHITMIQSCQLWRPACNHGGLLSRSSSADWDHRWAGPPAAQFTRSCQGVTESLHHQHTLVQTHALMIPSHHHQRGMSDMPFHKHPLEATMKKYVTPVVCLLTMFLHDMWFNTENFNFVLLTWWTWWTTRQNNHTSSNRYILCCSRCGPHPGPSWPIQHALLTPLRLDLPSWHWARMASSKSPRMLPQSLPSLSIVCAWLSWRRSECAQTLKMACLKLWHVMPFSPDLQKRHTPPLPVCAPYSTEHLQLHMTQWGCHTYGGPTQRLGSHSNTRTLRRTLSPSGRAKSCMDLLSEETMQTWWMIRPTRTSVTSFSLTLAIHVFRIMATWCMQSSRAKAAFSSFSYIRKRNWYGIMWPCMDGCRTMSSCRSFSCCVWRCSVVHPAEAQSWLPWSIAIPRHGPLTTSWSLDNTGHSSPNTPRLQHCQDMKGLSHMAWMQSWVTSSFKILCLPHPFAQIAAKVCFNNEEVVHLYRDLLFVNFNQKSTTDDLSSVMAKYSLPHVQFALTVNSWHHIQTAWKHKFKYVMDNIIEGDEVEDVDALQAGHTRATENQGIEQKIIFIRWGLRWGLRSPTGHISLHSFQGSTRKHRQVVVDLSHHEILTNNIQSLWWWHSSWRKQQHKLSQTWGCTSQTTHPAAPLRVGLKQNASTAQEQHGLMEIIRTTGCQLVLLSTTLPPSFIAQVSTTYLLLFNTVVFRCSNNCPELRYVL